MAKLKQQTPPAAELDTRFGLPAYVPKNEQHRRFCEEYVKDQNAMQAAIRAGYSQLYAQRNAYKLVDQHGDYIKWLLAHQAQANVKQIAIELEPVLQEVAKIAFVNEYDYLVFEPSEDPKKPPTVRRKRLDELTREQMIPIRVHRTKNGTGLEYSMRDKEGRLIDLVKHLGGFSEKIILEHRHRHLHAHVDLTNVPLEQLEAMEAQMSKLIAGRTRGNVLEVK